VSKEAETLSFFSDLWP